MARGGGVNDLVYYGAIGGGLFLAWKLALDGDLGCDAYIAAADLYRSVNKGKAPQAPTAGSPASLGDCAARINNIIKPAPRPPVSTASPPAAPASGSGGGGNEVPVIARQSFSIHTTDGLCWQDTQWSDGSFTYQQVDPANCGIPPASTPVQFGGNFQSTSLTDMKGFPVVFDPNADALRQDPAQGGTNLYGVGDVFLDTNGSQWVWVGRADTLSSTDGLSATIVNDFFA